MRKLMLFLLLFGLSCEVRADGRVAITGVPVVGGHRTLYTEPPNGSDPQYDDYGRPLSVPYRSTHYARDLPGHLTLGQGSIEGRPWYFNSAGYNSYHYGEHYQPTGQLTEGYSSNTNSCGYSYSGNYTGGKLRELWVPIDRPKQQKMSVVTSPLPKYSGWYVNTPGLAGWLPGPGYIGPYGGYYDYLSSQPVWGQYQGHLYDKRLYREPAGGWEKPEKGVVHSPMASVHPIAEPAPATIPPKERCADTSGPVSPATKSIPEPKDPLAEWKKQYKNAGSQVDDGTLGNNLWRLSQNSEETLDIESGSLERIAPNVHRAWE